MTELFEKLQYAKKAVIWLVENESGSVDFHGLSYWAQGEWNTFYCDGMHYKTCERHWKGYFLFGIIPLWIENTSTKYR
jgi:hypothetical protein